MKIFRSIAMLVAALAMPAAGQSPAALQPAAPLTPAARAAAPAVDAMPGTVPAPVLDKADVDAWLDGLMPYGLKTGNIAGAVVVVVKDGRIVTQRGFGYADMKTRKPVDPAGTLFRPGSISKLFTWTAVMQQVQAGKLDLDRDINDYLDFRIPPKFGKPITLRHLMTHTAGFEETAKYLIATKASDNRPLGVALKRAVPPRIYAPGSTASYSNYGASLAGYIVERVSGEPFETYVDRHIFAPLGMAHSSFRQPLPGPLAAGLSQGYDVATGDPKAYEIIPLSPAGALSATGTDMARFMIAHLDRGGPLLDPKTAAQMYATANVPIPGMPGMALGFYHEDRNGLRIIGHGGDTNWFHSDLHLYLDKGVGLYLSFNSAGKDGAAHTLREQLFDDFTDRYFPHPAPMPPAASTAADHGRAMAGHYVSSRGSVTNWLRLVSLVGEAEVTLNDDDTITVSSLVDAAGVPKRWREIAPWQWRVVGGEDLLGAKVENGRVTAFAPRGFAPIILFLPASTAMDAGWILPVAMAALAILLLAALAWPIVAVTRRRYGYRGAVSGRSLLLHRVTRATAWILVIVALGWAVMITSLDDVAALDGRLDIWMRLLQLLTLVGIVGTILSVWNAWVVARSRDRAWTARIWAVLVAIAALFMVWFFVSMRMLTFALNY